MISSGHLSLALSCLLAAGAATAAPQLPDMGAAASATLSPADERELGRQMMAEVRRQLPLVDDAEITDYLQDLGERLATRSDAPGLKFEFFVVDQPAINAFAMPGGYIGVNVGLILNARRESELAAVLAHEIAHVTQRHIARRIAASGHTSLRTMALILAGVLLGTQDAQVGSAVTTAGMAGTIQQQLNFSRAFEQEADNLGIRMLAAADLDPRGMPIFFGRLVEASRYYDRPPDYLSTHPANAARIAESTARAEAYGKRDSFESPGFQLTKNKLEVLKAQQPAELAARFRDRLRGEAGESAAATRYGLALALAANREFEPARALLDDLIKSAGEQPNFLLALARVEQASGRTQASLDHYAQALALYPDHLPARRYYAQALIDAGKAGEAYGLLTRSLPSDEPQVYWLLARAAAEARLGAEPQLAMAEYYRLSGDPKAALIQLDQALSNGRADAYQAARAAARREELQRELANAARD